MEEDNNRPLEPFKLFGVECGKGWNTLLQPIFDYILEYNKDKPKEEQIHPLQIKEKWGELRVYMNFVTPELDKIIDNAIEESHFTCELCGSKQDVGTICEGWITTACHECVEKMSRKRERPYRWRRRSDGLMYWVYYDKEDEKVQQNQIP